MLNLGTVSNVLGLLMIVLGIFMLTVIPFSLYFDDGDINAFLISSAISIVLGLGTYFSFRQKKHKIGKRDGYLIVALGWMSMVIFSTLPYYFSGYFESYTDCFFESVSGLTTTGASILTDIESMPKGILFWRSLTQWIGGMGIIVLTVAIFPLLGIGGVELFVAEAPGPTSDKIHPRIKEVAKRLWFIYLGLTVALVVILYLEGMTFFDAINHAMTTMSTGGFSTKNASVAHFTSPLIQYTILIFMFIGGINYTIIYFGLLGRFRRMWRSDEFKTYLFLVFGVILMVSTAIWIQFSIPFEQAFREAGFQIVSLITTTGFITKDYTAWTPTITFVFFILLFLGACAGSTSGGIKIIRHLVFFRNTFLEYKRLLHPSAIIRTKVDGYLVPQRILTHILVFLLIYLSLFVLGSIVMVQILHEFEHPILTALGAVATSLGNVGPGIGELGPVDNFAAIPDIGKWFLGFLMLLGRLELFTILILFTPYFWKLN